MNVTFGRELDFMMFDLVPSRPVRVSGLLRHRPCDALRRKDTPSLPNTGALLKVNSDGTFTVLLDGLNQPTSLEFIGHTAFVVTLTGEVWRIDDIVTPPKGK